MSMSPKQRERFLQTLTNTCSIGDACAAAAVTRATAFKEARIDTTFQVEWERAVQTCVDEAKRRASDGVDKTLIQKCKFTYKFRPRLGADGLPELSLDNGQIIYDPVYEASDQWGVESVREYSDSQIARLLKAHAKEKYSDRRDLNVKGDISIIEAIRAGRKRMRT